MHACVFIDGYNFLGFGDMDDEACLLFFPANILHLVKEQQVQHQSQDLQAG